MENYSGRWQLFTRIEAKPNLLYSTVLTGIIKKLVETNFLKNHQFNKKT